MDLLDEYIAELSSMPYGAEDDSQMGSRLFAAFNEEMSYNARVDIEERNWPSLAARLRGVKDKREHELAIAEASAPKQRIEQSVSVDVSLAMNQAFAALDALGLPDDEVRDAKLALAEAQNEPDAEKRSEKVFKAMKWAVENGPKAVDAITKVAGMIQQLPPLT